MLNLTADTGRNNYGQLARLGHRLEPGDQLVAGGAVAIKCVGIQGQVDLAGIEWTPRRSATIPVVFAHLRRQQPVPCVTSKDYHSAVLRSTIGSY